MYDLKKLAHDFELTMGHGGSVVETVCETVIPLENGDRMVIANNFDHDGPSIPKWVPRWILPKYGTYNLGAAAHDLINKIGGYFTSEGKWVPCTRKRGDQIFLEIIRRSGIRIDRRNTMYIAVRLGGKPAWDNHRKHDEETKTEEWYLAYKENAARCK